MNIPASVDLSTIDDINEYAEKFYGELAEDRPRINTIICIVKGKINEKLQKKNQAAYEAISAYAETKEFADAAEYDYELRCFKTASNIYQLERGAEITVFDNLEYVDNFAGIYEQTIRYFMRIQLGFTRALSMECMAFFRQNKLSVLAVVQMLTESSMGEKERIAEILAGYYLEQGLKKEALYIVSVFEGEGRPEFKERFTSKKKEILSLIG